MTALILGVGGQDGSYLAEQLLAERRQRVHGTIRPRLSGTERPVTWPLSTIIHPVDICDRRSVERVLAEVQPDEIYNLAAVTAPGGKWGQPQPRGLAEVNAFAVVGLLDACLKICPNARVVHASSSAVYDPHRYGLYGISKRFAHDVVTGYQGRLHVSNAVLYSHTSMRQDRRFFAPTAVRTLAAIAAGQDARKLVVTEFAGKRDWGYAPDLMRALPKIAAADRPGDYDIATGRVFAAGDFVDYILRTLGLGWSVAVEITPGPAAPPERPADLGPAAAVGWKPEVTFESMVAAMTTAAYATAAADRHLPSGAR